MGWAENRNLAFFTIMHLWKRREEKIRLTGGLQAVQQCIAFDILKSVFENILFGERYDTKRTMCDMYPFSRQNVFRSLNHSLPSMVSTWAIRLSGRTRKKHRRRREMIHKKHRFIHLQKSSTIVDFLVIFYYDIIFYSAHTFMTIRN